MFLLFRIPFSLSKCHLDQFSTSRKQRRRRSVRKITSRGQEQITSLINFSCLNLKLDYLKNYLYSFTFSHELSAKHYICLKLVIRKKVKETLIDSCPLHLSRRRGNL